MAFSTELKQQQKKSFTIRIETEKTPNNQNNLEKEKQSWGNQAPWLSNYNTKLQSYDFNSMVLAQE